ncbi:hypothetical protein [Dactylosporangium salmoneum]|uniref:Uncharacterized protein n=1 Tax=Dactylosporangium salmoneum TaxID=53361 RepID=A0ABP5TFR0_9ACTN
MAYPGLAVNDACIQGIDLSHRSWRRLDANREFGAGRPFLGECMSVLTGVATAVSHAVRMRSSAPAGAGGDGFAVRIDWPACGGDGIKHDFTQFTPKVDTARRRAARAAAFWRRGPLLPLAVTVVPISRAAFWVHPRDCTLRECPTAAPLYGMRADGHG